VSCEGLPSSVSASTEELFLPGGNLRPPGRAGCSGVQKAGNHEVPIPRAVRPGSSAEPVPTGLRSHPGRQPDRRTGSAGRSDRPGAGSDDSAGDGPGDPAGRDGDQRCQDFDPAFSVVNDSDQPIVFGWSDQASLNRQRTLAGGDSFLEPWPQSIIGDGPLGKVPWTASANGAVFDQGTLSLDGPSGLFDCDADFSATLVAAQCFTGGGVQVFYDTSAPVGYDSVSYHVVVGNDGAPLFGDWERSLPQQSTGAFFVDGSASGPATVNASIVTFTDADGGLPEHTIVGNIIPAPGC
jgi:hypothetical protein